MLMKERKISQKIYAGEDRKMSQILLSCEKISPFLMLYKTIAFISGIRKSIVGCIIFIDHVFLFLGKIS